MKQHTMLEEATSQENRNRFYQRHSRNAVDDIELLDFLINSSVDEDQIEFNFPDELQPRFN